MTKTQSRVLQMGQRTEESRAAGRDKAVCSSAAFFVIFFAFVASLFSDSILIGVIGALCFPLSAIAGLFAFAAALRAFDKTTVVIERDTFAYTCDGLLSTKQNHIKLHEIVGVETRADFFERRRRTGKLVVALETSGRPIVVYGWASWSVVRAFGAELREMTNSYRKDAKDKLI